MWGLLATLLFSSLGSHVDAACPRTYFKYFNDTPCLNYSGGFPFPKVNFSVWKQVKELDLSNNNITTLSELKSGKNLESLFLHNNKLKSLPSDFFDKTPKLKVLSLEKNQLSSLSIENFHHCLKELRVDCHCNVADGLLNYCYNCSDRGIKCQCFTSERLDNVTDYYENKCHVITGYSVYVAITIAILILLLLAILVVLVIWWKKRAPVDQEKRPSNTSEGTSGQSRYISRLHSPGNTFQDMGIHKDYENVFNDQPKGKVGKMKTRQGNHQSRKETTAKRSPSKAENRDSSEGHQPVYANTQELYYNYSGRPIPEAVDDVYIIPDQ
ncbi:leucine-rich repeat-containing protein 25 [Pseudonaja textilis]|uniref:Leucine rich repeat containing 25 n=1 Tax=Pseudonaja textilis TaxID=8673 RepID=A0A670Y0H2_PSETE|nr:leucine-rich repeat-containing protein 25 [Pseudonaja textilis]